MGRTACHNRKVIAPKGPATVGPQEVCASESLGGFALPRNPPSPYPVRQGAPPKGVNVAVPPPDSTGPLARYLPLLLEGDTDALLGLFSHEPHIDDPFGGHMLGADEVRRFLEDRYAWLRNRRARAELL